MVNNVTVILVVRDTCKINTTSTARTVPVPSNVRSHNNSASLFWLRHCFHRRFRQQHHTTSRVCATKNVRLVDNQHNASCTLPNWQWHCDCKIIKRQQRHCPHLTYNAIHLTVSRTIHRFQSRGHSLPTPKELRALNDCWANGWRWHLAEAQAANDSVRYSSRSDLRSQFAYPERITRHERLLSE